MKPGRAVNPAIPQATVKIHGEDYVSAETIVAAPAAPNPPVKIPIYNHL